MGVKDAGEKIEKIREEFKSLLPESLKDGFDKYCYLAGGAIFSLYNGEEPKDYDFFSKSQVYADQVHFYFSRINNLKFRGGIRVGTYKLKTLIVTDNAVSIDNKFQIITKWVGEPKEVIGQFDFKHNQFYYMDKKIHALTKWEHLEEKVLRYNDERARDICGTIIRVKKFVERGFTISNKEMAKMLLKLNEVGFNERELEILSAHDERNDFGS